MSFNIEEQLRRLGDPSGRQDAEYWDSWFKLVCVQHGHKSFEWYSNPEEVVRVISYHLNSQKKTWSTSRHESMRMIHPGSGTSLLPLVLREEFEDYEQVVVDVSETAIAEMRQIHDKSNSVRNHDDSPIKVSYVLEDILKPPMQFDRSSFHCWIDKGFVDAIFAKEAVEENKLQSTALFGEAHRLLVPQGGFMLIVTLAEEHTLQIILNKFLSKAWDPVLHVWEMLPVSGTMRPFAFVLVTRELLDGDSPSAFASVITVIWHEHSSTEDHASSIHNVRSDELKEKLGELVERSRHDFRSATTADRQNNNECLMLVFLEIKPVDTDVDLIALSNRVRSKTDYFIGEKQLRITWRPLNSSENNDTCYHMVVPIGYGVCKLQLSCVVSSECTDDLPEAIHSSECDSVMSVDIDWTQTVLIPDT